MKKLYNAPEMELILLASEDVCSASDPTLQLGGEDEVAGNSKTSWGDLNWGGEQEF